MKRPGIRRAAPAPEGARGGGRLACQVLHVRNRQHRQRIDTPRFRRLLLEVLASGLGVTRFEVGVHLVGDAEMTVVNETFLRHAGSTDVITFNHRDRPSVTELEGELFVCVDEAERQAPRFRSTWQQEMMRYAVHGFLHLQGHDDQTPMARARMKRMENRVMRTLRRRGELAGLDRSWKNARQD